MPKTDALRQQITYRLVMQIEGRTVDTCRLADFFHRNISEILLIQQCQKCLIHLRGCIEILALGFIQLRPPSF